METVGPVEQCVDSRLKPSPPVSQLVRLLWGEDTVELQMSIAHIPHIVMYLSLKLDSESPQEEVSLFYRGRKCSLVFVYAISKNDLNTQSLCSLAHVVSE